MTKFHGSGLAIVVWRAEDVHRLKPSWTLPRCEEWLQDNEHRIEERLTELGWEVIDTMLMMERDNDD